MTVIHRSKGTGPLVTVRLGKNPATEGDDDTTESALTQVDEIALGFVDAGRYPTIQKARVAVFERNPQLAEKVRAEAIAKARTPHAPRPAQEMGPLEADLQKSAEQAVATGKAPSVGVARGRMLLADPTLTTAIRKERGQ